MGFLDKLFGHEEPQRQPTQNTGAFGYGTQPPPVPNIHRPQNADEQAVARYRYMLQTAPPEDIERAHEESFARLSPQQRQLLLQQLSQNVPANEAQDLRDDPRSLARAATRAEVRQPGFIERTFGGQHGMQGGYGQPMMGGGGGMLGGMGGMLAGGLLSSMAGSFIGSSIANSFFSHQGNEQSFLGSPEAQAVPGGISDYNPSDYNTADFEQGGGGLDASTDPYGDPADGGFQNASLDQNAGYDPGSFDAGGGGLDASADPYGDPADAGSFDGGGFDSGGFDGGDIGGGDF